MNIIEIKDVITSKRNPEFPELIRTVVFSASKEIDGQDVVVDSFSVGLPSPTKEGYLSYENISDDQLKQWALEALSLKEDLVNDLFKRRLQRLKNEQQQLNQ